MSSASDDVEVFDLPVVTFTALADLCLDAGVQAGTRQEEHQQVEYIVEQELQMMQMA